MNLSNPSGSQLGTQAHFSVAYNCYKRPFWMDTIDQLQEAII